MYCQKQKRGICVSSCNTRCAALTRFALAKPCCSVSHPYTEYCWSCRKDLTSAKPPVYRPDPPAPSAVSPAKSATKVTNLESGDVTPTTAINTDPQHSPDDAILASDAGEGQLSASSQNSSHVYSDVVGNETISIQNSALVNNDSHIVAENDTPVQKVLDDGTTDLTEKTGLLLNPSDLTMFSLPVDDTSCDLDSATLEGIAKGCEHTAEKPADTDSDISASNCRHAEAGETHMAATHEFTVIEYDLSNQTHTVGRSSFYVNRHATTTLENRKHPSRPPLRFHAALQLSDRPELFESLQG